MIIYDEADTRFFGTDRFVSQAEKELRRMLLKQRERQKKENLRRCGLWIDVRNRV